MRHGKLTMAVAFDDIGKNSHMFQAYINIFSSSLIVLACINYKL